MKFTQAQILDFESLYRRNFMNSITGVKSAGLIGTVNAKQQTNLAIFNSFVHIGATPPHIGFVMRPTTVERHTFDNIQSQGFYTINHIHNAIIEQAHQTSAKYDRATSEFEACGFTPAFKTPFTAPYVKEATIQLGLSFVESIHIKSNDVHLVIGEVKEVYVEEKYIQADGFIDLAQAATVGIGGLDAYYKITPLARFAYARPDQPVKFLEN
ncbi:MAG: flavin reductase [Bacteroidota bacterium]